MVAVAGCLYLFMSALRNNCGQMLITHQTVKNGGDYRVCTLSVSL